MIEYPPINLGTFSDPIVGLILIVGPVLILDRLCSWLGVWDVPDDINGSAQ